MLRTSDFGLSMNMKNQFFDKLLVKNKVEAAKLKVLSKAGRWTQVSARRSMRRRKGVSPAGSPPSAHSTHHSRTLKNIWFVYDRSIDGVVVGPVRFPSRSPDAPELSEYGGRAMRQFFIVKDKKTKKDKIVFSAKAPPRAVHYQSRPFMRPAMEENLPKFLQAFKDAIRR